MKVKVKFENGQLSFFKDGQLLNPPFGVSMGKAPSEERLSLVIEAESRVSVIIPAEEWEVEVTVPPEVETALDHVCVFQ